MSDLQVDIEARNSSEMDGADYEFLLEKASHQKHKSARSECSRDSRHATIIIVLATLLITHLASFFIGRQTTHRCVLQESVAEPPSLAPLLRDLHIGTRHVKFDSTFFDQGSRYRAPPSPKTDAAWESAGANCK